MRWSGVLAGAIALISAGSALAGTLDTAFGNGPACYARAYDKAHLASHPQQRVREVQLTNVREETGEDRSGWDMLLDFGFTLTDGSDYLATAYCRDDKCGFEGDGGWFAVDAAQDGGLRLSIVGDFLQLEGDNFSGNLAESDDKVFLLYPITGRACEPA